MSAPSVANILKSGAIPWYAPEGEDLPDDTDIAAGADWGGQWKRLGFTKEPLKLVYKIDKHEIEVEELLMPVSRVKIGIASSMETVLSELTADYLALATGGTVTTTAPGATQVGVEVMEAGDNVQGDPVYTFGIEGVRFNADGDALPIRIGFYRCTIMLNGDLKFSRRDDDHTGTPLEVAALGMDDGTPPFWFRRVTAPATGA